MFRWDWSRVKKERKTLHHGGAYHPVGAIIGQNFNHNGLCLCNTCAGTQSTLHWTRNSFMPPTLTLPLTFKWGTGGVGFLLKDIGTDDDGAGFVPPTSLVIWQPTQLPEQQLPVCNHEFLSLVEGSYILGCHYPVIKSFKPSTPPKKKIKSEILQTVKSPLYMFEFDVCRQDGFWTWRRGRWRRRDSSLPWGCAWAHGAHSSAAWGVWPCQVCSQCLTRKEFWNKKSNHFKLWLNFQGSFFLLIKKYFFSLKTYLKSIISSVSC